MNIRSDVQSQDLEPSPGEPIFVPLPVDEHIHIGWPTPNQFLLNEPSRFFARTRVNHQYGMPGWTRDCGRRPHYGCDIAPLSVTSVGKSTTVEFTDCLSGTDFLSSEPVLLPHDPVFCVFDGEVDQVVTDETMSPFGRHIVVAHRWPGSGQTFFTLYGHLAECTSELSLRKGQQIGRMGQTSSIADARNWMLIAPHLHFEARNFLWQPHDPADFLRRYLAS